MLIGTSLVFRFFVFSIICRLWLWTCVIWLLFTNKTEFLPKFIIGSLSSCVMQPFTSLTCVRLDPVSLTMLVPRVLSPASVLVWSQISVCLCRGYDTLSLTWILVCCWIYCGTTCAMRWEIILICSCTLWMFFILKSFVQFNGWLALPCIILVGHLILHLPGYWSICLIHYLHLEEASPIATLFSMFDNGHSAMIPWCCWNNFAVF